LDAIASLFGDSPLRSVTGDAIRAVEDGGGGDGEDDDNAGGTGAGARGVTAAAGGGSRGGAGASCVETAVNVSFRVQTTQPSHQSQPQPSHLQQPPSQSSASSGTRVALGSAAFNFASAVSRDELLVRPIVFQFCNSYRESSLISCVCRRSASLSFRFCLFT
jgi:hypothetical protein